MTQLFIDNWMLNVTEMLLNKWLCFTETFTDMQKIKGEKNLVSLCPVSFLYSTVLE